MNIPEKFQVIDYHEDVYRIAYYKKDETGKCYRIWWIKGAGFEEMYCGLYSEKYINEKLNSKFWKIIDMNEGGV